MVKKKGIIDGTVELLMLLKGFLDGGNKKKGIINGTVELLMLLKGFLDGGNKRRRLEKCVSQVASESTTVPKRFGLQILALGRPV